MTNWIPATVDDLFDYLGWMIGRMPDFPDPYGVPMAPDLIFSNARIAIEDLEQELSPAIAATLQDGMAAVRGAMDAGDIFGASHQLQDLMKQFEHVTLRAAPNHIDQVTR